MSITISQSLIKNIDLVTDENQTEDDWSKILDVCEVGSKDVAFCFQYINKRMNSRNPHTVLRSLILMDACMQNIGEQFANELSSKKFFNDIKSRSPNWQPKIIETLCFMSKKWNREFNDKVKYAILNELDNWLADKFSNIYTMIDQNEINNKGQNRSNRKQVAALKEEQDLAAAIAASLKDAEPAKNKAQSSLYPTTNETPVSNVSSNVTAPQSSNALRIPRVRALYDFQAEDENELSFSAGEIIVDVDTGNEHWWFGHNQRGEGLFPAQFVTTDVGETNDASQKRQRSQSPKGQNKQSSNTNNPPVPIQIVIDESKIDSCLKLIDEADPTGEIKPDTAELLNLESNCREMGPLIDQELEKVDRHYNSLVEINKQVMIAFQTYNELMLGSTLAGSSTHPAHSHLPQTQPAWMASTGNAPAIGSNYQYNFPAVNSTTNVQPPLSQTQYPDYMNSSGPFNMFYGGNLQQMPNNNTMSIGQFNTDDVNSAAVYQSMQQPQPNPMDSMRQYMTFNSNIPTGHASMTTTNNTMPGNTSTQLASQHQNTPAPNGTNNNNIAGASDYQQFNYNNVDNNTNSITYGVSSIGISSVPGNSIYSAPNQPTLTSNQNLVLSHPTITSIQQQSIINQPGFNTDSLNPQQPIQTNPY